MGEMKGIANFLVRACVSYLEYVLGKYCVIDFFKLGLVNDNRFWLRTSGRWFQLMIQDILMD